MGASARQDVSLAQAQAQLLDEAARGVEDIQAGRFEDAQSALRRLKQEAKVKTT